MSAWACSRLSARCMGATRRQFRRSTLWSCCAAIDSQTSQWAGSMSKPSPLVAAMESIPIPLMPAARGPEGETAAATAISTIGCV